MLSVEDMIDEVDINGDGKIDYEGNFNLLIELNIKFVLILIGFYILRICGISKS